MRALLHLVLLVGLGLAATVAPARAQSADAARCKALEGDYATIEDAPSQVISARVIDAANGVPAHCEVQGYVQPTVGFVLELPVANWSGRFLEHGCGGFCGAAQAAACDVPVKHGFACIASDMGHRSTGTDGKWAYNDLQTKIDFAFRSTHVVLLAGRAIAEKYYGKPAHHSYYTGCSTGGRQGFVEAERFPWDFDGIIGGAPVINETGGGMSVGWNAFVTIGPNGRSLLSPDDLRKVHAAAVAACDADDGVKDGLIGDPRSCKFDPATVSGLSAAQIDAIRKIYKGATNSKGEALYTGGAMPGSELNWIGAYIAPDGGPSSYAAFIGDMFRYMSFLPDPGAAMDVTKFNWDHDYKRFGMMEQMYSGSNPDLRKFKANGGKLLSYQGWADQSVLPPNVIDFYDMVERLMGGRKATQDFFRVFMVPGMAHCQGGEGADTIDYLGAMVDWVENNKAPDMLMSYHLKTSSRPFTPADFPVDPANVVFSRPVYPYPIQAHYKGGDVNSAASFGPKGK